MAKHYIEVNDEIWAELGRLQKKFKIDRHTIADDVFALAGDLEAIAEAHVNEPETSTGAAVLEPSASELADLI